MCYNFVDMFRLPFPPNVHLYCACSLASAHQQIYLQNIYIIVNNLIVYKKENKYYSLLYKKYHPFFFLVDLI